MTKPAEVYKNTQAAQKLKRCAIYARYSSDMQRESSIEDQIRKCREYAAKQEWIVVEDYIRYDQAVSGATDRRPALQSLLASAEQKPSPFDVLLVDDTSRLARNLEDQRSFVKLLWFLNVSVVSVSQGLDSSNESADISFTVLGLLDERFLKDLANKVRRGQEGCVLGDKYIAGGRCYGYENVPDEDPTRPGDYGRAFVRGVMRRVNSKEKPIVERIFQMYETGFSFDKIAKSLRADGVPAPRPPRKNSVRGWSADGISAMLRNPIYIGQYIWKRTINIRDPRTRKMETRAVPEAEWVRSCRPDWRIISDDLWNRVQERRAMRRHIGFRKLGGLGRTKRSQEYLFSGLLFCGAASLNTPDGSCDRPITIVDSGEIVRYGCGAHRYKGACTNALTIRRDSLEQQLLRWLTHDLLQGDRLERVAKSFRARLEACIAERQLEACKCAINVPELRKERSEKMQEAWSLTEFIVASGSQTFETVKARLATAEARIKDIDELLALAKQPETIAFTAEKMAEYLRQSLANFQCVLTSTPLVGKEIIRKHIRKITLTPDELNGKRMFHAAVEFELPGGNSGVMLTESQDASMQQYGFSTITITGPTLEACRVYRKQSHSKQNPGTERGITVLPLPIPETADPTQASDSALTAIHA